MVANLCPHNHATKTLVAHLILLLFSSSKFNSSFPTIPLSLPEGREFLTVKSIKASVYVYETYGQEYDWFLKADDDTYVIVENLRRLLQPLDPDKPLYLGYRFKPYDPQGMFYLK